jgi:hypothetical protein
MEITRPDAVIVGVYRSNGIALSHAAASKRIVGHLPYLGFTVIRSTN